jgi:hypothetical protein
MKVGVPRKSDQIANALSLSTNDLYFELSRQELNFWMSNPVICDANFFKLSALAQPEFSYFSSPADFM